MVDISSSRRIVLLVPAPEAGGVLAQGTELPTFDCTPAAGESTIEAVAPMLATFGLHQPVLDCVVDQVEESELGSEPRAALVQLAAPLLGWRMPPEWAWLPWNELEVTPTPGLALVLETRIAELRGDSAVPQERAAWSRPGWYEQVTEWVKESLEAAGRSPADAMVQARHWGISSLVRVEAADGQTWFKASFPPFGHEAAITEKLAELAPGTTCGVVATETSNGWLLLDDFDGTIGATDPDTTRKAIDHLVRLQKDMQPHRAVLRAAGAANRTLVDLAVELRESLRSEVAISQLELTPELIADLVEAVTAAAASIDAVGLPETLVHGDFHPGNVAVTDAGMVLFDWSDAAIANPVIDLATWAWWHEDDEPRIAELWQLFCLAWQREFDIDVSRLRRVDVDIVAGAFHTVSYVQILSALEPADQVSHADGLDYFFALLTSAVAERSGS